MIWRRARGLFAFLALVVVGCGSRVTDDRPDSGTVLGCATSAECDDGFECTVDACGVSGTCEYTTIDERCGAGESCVVGRGCTAGTTCTTTADCDDAIACTIDTCVVGGTCDHMPIHERCTDTEVPMCDPVAGCIAGTGCTSAAMCDDAIDCTVDTCGADMTCRHTTVNERCATGQMCSASMGCYTPRPCTTASDCDDGVFCNGVEQCVPEFGCAEAAMPRACSDTDECTVDRCDATADMCVFACDSSRAECGCTPPPDGCNGTFTVTGDVTYQCLMSPLTGEWMSGYDFSSVTFVNDGFLVTAQPMRYWTTSDGLSRMEVPLYLTDDTAPICPMFDVVASVGGTCAERYELVGEFTDADHFTARLIRTYTGSTCATYGCVSGMADVTGTRAP